MALTKEILVAKRGIYEQGRVKALAQVNAFTGAVEAIDDLLALLAQAEESATQAARPVDVTDPGKIEEPEAAPQEEGEHNA